LAQDILMRTFPTGATRNPSDTKLDYEGFLSHRVLERYAVYMDKARHTPEGLRASDNWQLGIPKAEYVKSAWRHFMEFWGEHRGAKRREVLEGALCALLFNLMGYLHELLGEEEGK
jgi:hypothetical protein